MNGTVTTKQAVEWGGKEPFRYGFLDLSGTGAGPFLPLVNLASAAGAPLDPATSEGQATASGILQQILGALQAARAETIWTDDSGAYYLRVDNDGTLTWLTPAGGESAAPGAGARPADAQAVIVDRSAYQATADGSGFANGDYLDHYVTIDGATGTVLQNFWLNATQGVKLGVAPPPASVTPLAPLPRGAALDASLQAIKTVLGAPAQDGADITSATMPAGGSGIRGWLSAMSASIGAKVDAAATSCTASLIALLKDLVGFFIGAAPTSRSTTTPATPGSQLLFPSTNPARRKWLVQAPMQDDLWINPLGGSASPDGLDCVRLPAGSLAQSDGICCETTAFNYWCGTGGLNITAWEL